MVKLFLWMLIIATLAACDVADIFFQSIENYSTQSATITYRSEAFNFELDYPVGWFVEETDYGTRFWSFVPGALPIESFHALPPKHTRLTVSPSPDATPLAKVIMGDVQEMAFSGGCLYADATSYRLNTGALAVEITATSDHGGDYKTIYTRLNASLFIFDVWGNVWDEASPVWEVVRSLRPITPSQYDEHRNNFEEIYIEEDY